MADIKHNDDVIGTLRDKRGRFARFPRVKRAVSLLVKWLAVLATTLLVILALNTYLNPRVVTITRTVEIARNAPVLERIALAESGNSQVDKRGQVVLHANKDGSVDIGVFQINNTAWGKIATSIGYNLTIERDNRAFAQYLYETYGTEPWYSSRSKWNK